MDDFIIIVSYLNGGVKYIGPFANRRLAMEFSEIRRDRLTQSTVARWFIQQLSKDLE